LQGQSAKKKSLLRAWVGFHQVAKIEAAFIARTKWLNRGPKGMMNLARVIGFVFAAMCFSQDGNAQRVVAIFQSVTDPSSGFVTMEVYGEQVAFALYTSKARVVLPTDPTRAKDLPRMGLADFSLFAIEDRSLYFDKKYLGSDENPRRNVPVLFNPSDLERLSLRYEDTREGASRNAALLTVVFTIGGALLAHPIATINPRLGGGAKPGFSWSRAARGGGWGFAVGGGLGVIAYFLSNGVKDREVALRSALEQTQPADPVDAALAQDVVVKNVAGEDILDFAADLEHALLDSRY
jgi:hypothetical protein